jgi:hypothetical protein
VIFESCVDILSCDRIPQSVTIEPIMPYTNVDIFREKGAKIKKKKNLGATVLTVLKNHIRLFVVI